MLRYSKPIKSKTGEKATKYAANPQYTEQRSRLFRFPSNTAVVLIPAFVSGAMSGIAEYKCIAHVHNEAAITILRGGMVLVNDAYAIQPGKMYSKLDMESIKGCALKRNGGAL